MASLTTKCLSAASKGDLNTLRSLKNQIQLSECSDKFGATPVHYAARAGRVDCLRWLIQEAGANGNKPANNGASPAHDAAATGQLDCLQWLIENGGCSATGRDTSGATPLHLAARFGHLGVVVWLVESEGCSVLDKAQNGVTPIHLAAAKGSVNCLKWLSQSNPLAVNKRADNGTTPIYFAAQEGRLECLQFLISQVEGNCRLRASDGMAPVHAAAQMGQLECLVWLIENAGVSPNERDNDGATPAHFAAARGHVSILRWLFTHGGKVETDDLGGTPLHDAAEHGQLEALKVLVATGVDPHTKDLDAMTPADLADECKHLNCANYLRSQKSPDPPEIVDELEKPKADIYGFTESYLVKSPASPRKPVPPPVIIAKTTKKAVPATKKQPTIPKPANMALMSEKNELKHVFRQLRTSSGDPVEETSDKEDMEEPKISVITLEQPKAVHNDALERKLDEFERQTKKAAAKMKNIEPVEKQAKRYGKGSATKVQLKKKVVPQRESSSDSDTDEGKHLRVGKKQKSALLSEVRQFEPDALKTAPPVKKNLVPTKLGRIREDKPKKKRMIGQMDGNDSDHEPEPEPQSASETEEELDSDEAFEDVPLWKRALVKKRAEEERRKKIAKKKEREAQAAKWTDIPPWKRAMLEKKELAMSDTKTANEVNQEKEAEKMAQFESLPEWKKIILQKRQD